MKILVAEDDQLMIKMLEFRLKKDGHEVIVTRDGREALAKLDEFQPDLPAAHHGYHGAVLCGAGGSGGERGGLVRAVAVPQCGVVGSAQGCHGRQRLRLTAPR